MSLNGIRSRGRVKRFPRRPGRREGSRIHPRPTRFGLAATLAIVLLAPFAPASPLEFGGRRASSAVVLTLDAHPDAAAFAGSPMLRELAGIAGVLDPRSLASLNHSAGIPLPIPEGAERVATIVLSRAGHSEPRPVLRIDDARLAILDPEDPTRAAPIRIDDMGALGIDTIRLTSNERPDPRDRIDADRWIGPTRASPIQLVGVTHRVRLGRGIAPRSPRPEPPRIRITLPDPGHAATPGALIWVSETPSGRVPEPIARACDQLGLVAIGVDHCGDTVGDADRAQRVLDALASVRSSLTIDAGRVYIAGFSGGARIASMMQLAFPDVFAGALAIGGLASHHDAPTGHEDAAWEATLATPTREARETLGTRRLGAVCGSVDFALPEMRSRASEMRSDGIGVRLEIVGGLAHAIPGGGVCAKMLDWIDDGAEEARRQRAQRARELLERVEATYAPDPAEDPRGRRLLVEITTLAPWSDPAWQAAAWLGFQRE